MKPFFAVVLYFVAIFTGILSSAEKIPFSGRIKGIDFSPNEFHLPETFQMKNAVPNSSFEEGFEYWQIGTWSKKTTTARSAGFRHFMEVDETTARSGKRSLKLNFGKGNCPSTCFFPVATIPGKFYTFSFYAKATEVGTTGKIRGVSDRWDHFPPALAFRMQTDWVRYVHTFKAPGKMLTLQIGAEEPSKKGSFWIDDVQFEEGERATPYIEQQIGVGLETSQPGNLSQPGEKAGVKLRVRSSQPGKGTLSCRIYDFFRNTLFQKTFSFELNKPYEPVFLPIPACDSFPSGVFIAEIQAKMENGVKTTSWKRFVRMNYLDGTHKNRSLFSGMGRDPFFYGDSQGFVAFQKRVGIGSVVSFQTLNPEYQRLLTENNIWNCGMLFNINEWKSDLGSRYSFRGAELFGKQGLKSLIAFPQSEIPKVVEEACRIIRKNPDVRVFKTVNEPHTVTEAETVKLIQILKAIRKEAEKIRPDIILLTPDCANIAVAIPYLEMFFRLGGAKACHAIGIHLYQGDPDVNDENLRTVIALSDRHFGKNSKIFQTEAGYYMPVRIPDLQLTGFFCGDKFRAGNLSYDVSRGEMNALAAQLRFRLATLKHAKRVAMDVDWNWAGNNCPQMGLDGIPNGIVFAINTPARLLGNADFIADIRRPGGYPRGYLFLNEFRGNGYGTGLSGKVPVAAIFSSQKGWMDVSAFPKNTVFFNALGAKFSPINGKIQLSPLCIFIATPGADAETLKKHCETAKTEIRFTGKPLECTHSLSVDGTLKLTFVNRGPDLLSGSLNISMPSESIDTRYELSLKPDERMSLSLKTGNVDDVLREKPIKVTFRSKKGNSQIFTPGASALTAHKVGHEFQNDDLWTRWDKIPASRLRPRFFKSAAQNNKSSLSEEQNFLPKMKLAWDEYNLYLFFDVVDNIFFPSPTPQMPKRGDCIQLFFDPLCDAKSLENYEDDDHWYEVLFRSGEEPQVFRRRAAQWQMAFNHPGFTRKVKSSFRKTANGYQCQFLFPASECAPVLLRSGSSFGFAPQIFDVDVFNSCSAVAGPGNMEILTWRGPEYYFKVFLTK